MSYKSLKETGTAISIILYGRWFKHLFIVAFVFILFIYLIFFFILSDFILFRYKFNLLESWLNFVYNIIFFFQWYLYRQY